MAFGQNKRSEGEGTSAEGAPGRSCCAFFVGAPSPPPAAQACCLRQPSPRKRGEANRRKDLERLLAHRLGDVVRLPDRQRHDGERRVLGRAGGELAAVGDEQVLDVVRLAPFVDDAVLAASRSSGWCRDCASRGRAASGTSAPRPPPRRPRAPAHRRGCAWRRRSRGRRNARSGMGSAVVVLRSACSVTPFFSCGMSSPTIHMPAMLS